MTAFAPTPFRVEISGGEIEDLRRRLRATRWPEPETVDDWSQGAPLAYVQDIKPIFDRDCLECHGSRDARGDYSVGTYADTMRRQRPGDAKSSVVVDCAPGGSMYRYFRGDAATAATKVFRWMVVYNGAETR